MFVLMHCDNFDFKKPKKRYLQYVDIVFSPTFEANSSNKEVKTKTNYSSMGSGISFIMYTHFEMSLRWS